MKSEYLVKKIMTKGGERFCMILNSNSGLPLYYQNIYLGLLGRQKNKSFNAILRNAYVLILFEKYLIKENISILERVSNKTFLSYTELYSLSEFLRVKRKKRKIIDMVTYKKVNEENLHYRLTVISDYISWIYDSFYRGSVYETNSLLKFIKSNFQKHKPKITSYSYMSDNFKSLEKETVEALLECVSPESEYNPFERNCRKRNQLAILILYETGMRGGELLNLKISDFKRKQRYLKISKRINDPEDPRVFQPLVKTVEREINISERLCMQISSYIEGERSYHAKCKNHDYLLVTHKSGVTEGLPLTISAYNKIMRKIKEIEHEGSSFRHFTGHCLRHTWNYIYSLKYIGVTDPYKLNELDRIRCIRMGWKVNSKSVLIYNNRFISEEASRAFQEADLLKEEKINNNKGGVNGEIDFRKTLGIKSKR
ncbi:tyrosine-type recombinase/integrase [Escherichia coli]|uniref:tyrosine-type recombinase/integrase n=1 Tax=Escherichia coli TaxID=562 RepID=UPI0035A914C5